MRILVVGGGGREHALVWKLAQSPKVGALFCAPGNAGTAALAEPVPAADLKDLVAAATRLRADLVVVGPEAPLAAGLADRLTDAGVPVFGPAAAAARIESSKAWAKEVMAEAGVPTARAVIVDRLDAARDALADFAFPMVVKADGLAAGKGVVIAESRADAEAALTSMLLDRTFGAAGGRVVLEEHLTGREVSVLALTDGETVLPLPPACDYKRAYDNDRGPNTGGMGAYAPVPVMDGALLQTVIGSILEPTVRALTARGTPLRGVLYAGLMLTANGPQVLEFNARFGDPETQVVLPLLDADLAGLLAAVAGGDLKAVPPQPPPTSAAVGVVLAAGGYPGQYQTGLPIEGLEDVPEDVLVFHAGTQLDDYGRVVTAGGRVLTVVGRSTDLASARDRAYAGADAISFPDLQLRRDIALREIVPQGPMVVGEPEAEGG
ncbi:MAG: phosphoribosylamine--glycine ligase [Chloroflexota bacterium]|nr:phosphoribosylamine--glycine ligase [Chloroflexota bacterium]